MLDKRQEDLERYDSILKYHLNRMGRSLIGGWMAFGLLVLGALTKRNDLFYIGTGSLALMTFSFCYYDSKIVELLKNRNKEINKNLEDKVE